MNTQIISKIKHQYKILKDLHGSLQRDELVGIISKDFNVDIIDVHNAINEESTTECIVKEYGLVIGRLMPPHYGHMHIINEVILDGKIPIMLLGDDNGADPIRNPLSYEQRVELIKLVYPNTEIIFYRLEDKDNWSEWFDQVGHLTVGNSGRHRDQLTLYYNNKEQDRYDHFEAYGKTYINEFYTKIFEDNDIRTKQVEFVERNDIHIDADATNIRDDFCRFRHLLDGRIYHKLVEWGWEDCMK